MAITRGRFIVIEGIDGAGTTTQARTLVDRLNDAGNKAIYTFEPSEGPIGTMIRLMLHRRVVTPVSENEFAPTDSDTMTLLFSADRLDHLRNVVEPALDKGITVVSDRYYYSTIAYQGVEGDVEWIRECNSRALLPDATYYLRLEADTALGRLGERGDLSIYEKSEFLNKVVKNYDALLSEHPEMEKLDGSMALDEVSEDIWQRVSAIMNLAD